MPFNEHFKVTSSEQVLMTLKHQSLSNTILNVGKEIPLLPIWVKSIDFFDFHHYDYSMVDTTHAHTTGERVKMEEVFKNWPIDCAI